MRTTWLYQMERLADDSGFRSQTLNQAAAQLREMLPAFPAPCDQPVAICRKGFRWFDSEMEAVADAIHRGGSSPHDWAATLSGPDWDVDRNLQGQWCVPGRCRARTARRASWEALNRP